MLHLQSNDKILVYKVGIFLAKVFHNFLFFCSLLHLQDYADLIQIFFETIIIFNIDRSKFAVADLVFLYTGWTGSN